MITIADIHVGSKVHYVYGHNRNKWANGIVKEIRERMNNSIWVVYNCCEKWDNYMEYTSALTYLYDLNLGWK